jgi:hypothetical protein
VAGCLIVFSGVVLYKITYHLDKHGKDHEQVEGRVRYRHVDGDQTEIEGNEDDVELWISSVQEEIRHNGDAKKAYEMESVGIQMGLPIVQVEDIDNEDDGDEDSVRHRIT